MTRPAHVLVAEDNALVSGAMRILFEESGYRVTIAHTITGTVFAATADPVDVLLLDLGLADGDGLTALSRLRAVGALPRVVVALTGRDEPEIRERCLAAGCRELLVKPVPTRELIAKVRGWTVSDAS
jgi:DNA-binding response OmpR family regulator